MKISLWLWPCLCFAWRMGQMKWYCGALFCILMHELAHGAVARIWGADVEVMRLGPAGAQLVLREPLPKGMPVFLLHMAGPLCNAILAMVCASAFIAAVEQGGSAELTREFWHQGCLINCGLAIFNLLPLYPLDGGRLLLLLLSEHWGYGRAFRILYIFSCLFTLFLFFLGIYLVQYHLVNFFLCMLALQCFRQAVAGRRYLMYCMEKNRGNTHGDLRPGRLSLCYEDESAMRLLERVPAGQRRDFSVVDRSGRLRGLLLEDELWSGLYRQGPDASASQLLHSRAKNERKVERQ